VASELSTPVPVVEEMPPEKVLRYFKAAEKIIKAKAG